MSNQLITSTAEPRARADLARRPDVPLTRIRPRRDTAWRLARGISDVVALALAAVLINEADAAPSFGWHAVIVPVMLLAFASAGAYRSRLRLGLVEELQRVLAASALVTASLAAILILTTSGTGIGDSMVIHWLLASTLLCGGRVGVYLTQRAVRLRSDQVSRALIVGAGEVGHLTAKRLVESPELGLRPIGFLDKEPLLGPRERRLRALPELPVVGASWDLEAVVREHDVEHVVVAFSSAPHHVLVDIVRRCWKLGVHVLVVPRLYEVEGRRTQVEHLGALPLVRVSATDPLGWQFAIKYVLDRVVSGAAMLLLSPLLAVLALAVLATMGRPILFRQRRVGRDGHVFEMLKFRTMRGAPDQQGEADASWASLVLSGDSGAAGTADEDRRTPLGALLRRLSLDELPQLWNVVRGDMSLIGPRPERTHYVERFEDVVYRYPDRHRVKSGLTGWAQVNGLRGQTSLADRIEWDNFYIENWSPWLDLRILARTIPALLGKERA